MREFVIKYFWVNGRLNRMEFWFSLLLLALLFLLPYILQITLNNAFLNSNAYTLWNDRVDSLNSLPLLWFLIFPFGNRLKSIGNSRLWAFCPLINIWFFIQGLFSKECIVQINTKVSWSWVLGLITPTLYLFLYCFVFYSSFPSSLLREMINELGTPKYLAVHDTQLNMANRVNTLLESITTSPTSRDEIFAYIDSVDTVIKLTKMITELTNASQELMLTHYNKAKTTKEIAELTEFWKRHNINIQILSLFKEQSSLTTEAMLASYLARKEYYQSVINGESDQTQQYLYDKYDKLHNIQMSERTKLEKMQTSLKDAPK